MHLPVRQITGHYIACSILRRTVARHDVTKTIIELKISRSSWWWCICNSCSLILFYFGQSVWLKNKPSYSNHIKSHICSKYRIIKFFLAVSTLNSYLHTKSCREPHLRHCSPSAQITWNWASSRKCFLVVFSTDGLKSRKCWALQLSSPGRFWNLAFPLNYAPWK